MATSTKQIIFFVFVALLYSGFYLILYSLGASNLSATKSKLWFMFSILVFVSAIYGYSKMFSIFSENYQYQNCKGCAGDCTCGGSGNQAFRISPYKICSGGPYSWQGDSKRATFCRELASTPEGMDLINRYSCGKGFHGRPGCGFKFTPISNACWNNERCNKEPSCNVEDNGIF